MKQPNKYGVEKPTKKQVKAGKPAKGDRRGRNRGR